MRRFENKVVVITGAASGIGLATVDRLASEGANIACLDVNEDGLAQAVATAEGRGAAAASWRCDVSKEADVVEAVKGAADRFGRIDSLVAMAGVLAAQHADQISLDEWNRLIGINLTGTFLSVRECIPHLLETKGNIVLAASTSSLQGHPYMTHYAASKGGVLAMMHTLAMEYARRGIRVNAVAPGGINTPMTANFLPPTEGTIDYSLFERISPLDEFRGPETVASAIAFLASDDAVHVNGEHIRVDGGTLA